jgi:hypothetical protein
MAPVEPYSTIILDEDSFISVHSQDEAEREDCVPILPNSRRVQFKPKVEVLDILNIEDYTQEEIQAIWSTAEELSMIQEERLQILQAVHEGTFVEDDKHTTRGLETRKERETREENTYTAIDCVLEEQDLQYAECVDNPEYIALLYQYCCLCSHTSNISMQQALKDRAECLAACNSSLQVEETNNDSLRASSKTASPWKDQSPRSSPKISGDKSSLILVVGAGCQAAVAACFEVNSFLNTAA